MCVPPPRLRPAPSANRPRAFTLVELLVVMGLIVALLALTIPALNALKGSSDITSAAYEVQGVLQTARAYAVSNRTYTWVGLFEEDVSKADQTPAVLGVGRLVISIVASRDGTPIYDTVKANWEGSYTSAPPTNQLLPISRLTQVGKLTKLDNIHLWKPPAYGNRPLALTSQQTIGFPGTSPHIPIFSFYYVGKGTTSKPQYVFGGDGDTPCPAGSGVVQFNPQGQCISEYSPSFELREIGLQASRGAQTIADPQSASVSPHNSSGYANSAAISIFAITGQAKIYRP